MKGGPLDTLKFFRKKNLTKRKKGGRSHCNGRLPLSCVEARQALRRPDPLLNTVDR